MPVFSKCTKCILTRFPFKARKKYELQQTAKCKKMNEIAKLGKCINYDD